MFNRYLSLRYLTVVTAFFTLCSLLNAQEPPQEQGIDAAIEFPDQKPQTTPSSVPKAQTNSDSDQQERVVSGAKRSIDIAKNYDYASLYDQPEQLKRLDKNAPIWASADRKYVALGAQVCLREGELEFFACGRNSKEHESIFTLDVPAHLIHAALLAIGAKQGAPAKYDPIFIPPTGEKIEIEVRWRLSDSEQIVKKRAQELILENESGDVMSSPWVFTGGLFGVNPDGKRYYLANVTGEIFGVSNFPGAVLDVPFESSSDNAALYYHANTDVIPPVDTCVLLLLSRQKDNDKEEVEKK